MVASFSVAIKLRRVNPSALGPAFRAAAVAFVPALAGAEASVWSRLESTVDAALASRPAAVRRQLGVFLRLLDLLSLLRHGRRLGSLDLPRRLVLLHRLERGPLLLLRRGVWGLRTLVFMGYYTQPEVIGAIGYRASPAGWAARR